MSPHQVKVGNAVFGGDRLTVIAGPCVIESADSSLRHAERLARIAHDSETPLIFKSSFDKANRTSHESFRGLGLEEGCRILERVREATGLPVITDIHEPHQARALAQSVDILQIPALLSRQTDLIVAAAETGRAVNLKKGQFLSPWEMQAVVAKAAATGNHRLLVTERGFSFGYNNLVSDMRSIVVMREFGYPIVFDATHSVQLPGAGGVKSLGQREFIAPLARAAIAAGADAVFMEVHEDPEHALSDGPNSFPLDHLRELLDQLNRLWAAVRPSNG